MTTEGPRQRASSPAYLKYYDSAWLANRALSRVAARQEGSVLVHEERAIRQQERRRILGAVKLHSDLGDIADLQRLLVELRGEARDDKREQRRLALLCGAILTVLEADDEPDVEAEPSQIDRWLGAA